MRSEKFESHLQDKIRQANAEMSKSRHGIIASYDHTTNTATVILSSPDSNVPGDILRHVPCPHYMGIQLSAPEPGRDCWVTFKGDRERLPMITHYYNHSFNHWDFKRHYEARHGVPRFTLSL